MTCRAVAGASKRRRLSSEASSHSKTAAPSRVGSDDEGEKANSYGASNGKKGRGAIARSQRERETRARQTELATQRAEAASKRHARSERRGAEGMFLFCVIACWCLFRLPWLTVLLNRFFASNTHRIAKERSSGALCYVAQTRRTRYTF